MSKMIEVKTSELEGKALDWAVATAQGWELRETYSMMSPEDGWGRRAPGPDFQVRDPWKSWHNADGSPVSARFHLKLKECDWHPSTDWSQGGPLIEKYQLRLVPYDAGYFSYTESMPLEEVGTTALIAACRAIVAAKLGDTVSVPAELLNHA